MKNFQVYKSSAGSGKTYTLMLIYLSLVLKEPDKFRNILAITFTNKAANEIKQRITANLKLVSEMDENNIPEKHKNLIEKLIENTGQNIEILKQNATRALTLILHNYSDFAVSTIDSFIHKIIRAFAFDLKLSMSFEVEMDDRLLLEKAVDNLIALAGSDNELTEVLVNFIQQKAEEDESWQIENLLTDFAKNLFREDAIAYLPLIQNIKSAEVSKFSLAIRKFVRNYEASLTAMGKEAMDLINRNELDESLFIGKSRGIVNFFRNYSLGKDLKKSPSDTIKKNVDQNSWLSPDGKKSPFQNTLLSIAPQLTEIFRKVENFKAINDEKVIVLEMVRQQLYPMSVLTEIRNQMEAIKKEENILPIAEFNRIVSEVVSNEPVPFIYERIGEKFRHYMIDEFQDTSVLQWLNLMPLVENSLSQGGLNMLVGDGKQAIYRFRNGDVDQFVRLPEVHNPSNNRILHERSLILQREFDPKYLGSNFRSKIEVVEFNNRFFNFIAPLFLGDQSIVYENGDQVPQPNNRGGFVQVEFPEDESENVADFYTRRTFELISDLCEKGYQPGDIAILCRSNNESSQIAVYLNDQGINVVSSDSLLLKNAQEIVFLIAWFTILTNEDDQISKAIIINYLIENHILSVDSKAEALSGIKKPGFFQQCIRQAVPGFSVQRLRNKALFDQTEELIRAFGLMQRSPLYIRFFLDEVLNFTSKGTSGVAAFLEFWEQNSNKLSVILPASRDSVQVMTIHKAKGLEFPVVIFPFAKQTISSKAEQVWALFDDDILPDLKIAYIKLSKNLEKTRYEELYTEVVDKKKLDLLNMVYVAFTRASERLFILSGKPKGKNDTINSVTDMLVAFLNSAGVYTDGKTVYNFGNEKMPGRKTEVDSNEKTAVTFKSWPWHERLIFASRAPRHWQANAPKTAQIDGNIIHRVLSDIRAEEDIEQAVQKLLNSGIVNYNKVDEITQRLKNLVQNPNVSRFFLPGLKVANEVEILISSGKSYRPDRIVFNDDSTEVIDYKTGRQNEHHITQVRHYSGLLTEMGYPKVSGWLIYLDEPVQVVEVQI
ncbi:MAG: UvrD-helicase domain-containing protein [Lentimicrobium sp.]|nr:UvrD-helicase domain-containing protein [Lentimicrobium sp.]